MLFHGKTKYLSMVKLQMLTLEVTCHGEIASVPGKRFLVGGLNPSEKYESQLGLLCQIYGKIIQLFQTTNQLFCLVPRIAREPPNFANSRDSSDSASARPAPAVALGGSWGWEEKKGVSPPGKPGYLWKIIGVIHIGISHHITKHLITGYPLVNVYSLLLIMAGNDS